MITSINIPGSKSISNRILILKKLSDQNFEIKNLSDSEDTKVLINALNNDEKEINLGLSGTAMRFLISYFAIKENRIVILKGEDRLNERPIGDLVESLNNLGADIKYLGNKGYPPIIIKGKNIKGGNIEIRSDISSQYISSLLLIAPFLENGLKLKLKDDTVSCSYIQATLNILNEFGVNMSKNESIITIYKSKLNSVKSYKIESDWSSASYYYSYVSLTSRPIKLKKFFKYSLQPDSELSSIYKSKFGINTMFLKNKEIILYKDLNFIQSDIIDINLLNNPDIAQTIIVNCLGLSIKANITGLQTLKIKETDRLKALNNELLKFNVNTFVTDVNFSILSYNHFVKSSKITIKTYKDHRMAMCFAPLLYAKFNIDFDNKNVVKKSYPDFWKDFDSLT